MADGGRTLEGGAFDSLPLSVDAEGTIEAGRI